MSKKRLEGQLAELRVLRLQEPSAANLAVLRRFLDKEGLVVAGAANLVADWNAQALGPDLVMAAERLSADGPESDPQCHGKLAIIKALRQMAWPEPEVFMLGCRVVQMEAVWGGKEDSAAPLRAIAAHALAECAPATQDQVLDTLVDLLADPAWTVRAEAVRAIAYSGYTEAARLLRLKLRLGDSEPRVLGACLDGLLALEKDRAVALLAEYLVPGRPERPEALAALAVSPYPQAIAKATSQWESVRGTPLGKVLLSSLAASPAPEAIDFLLGLLFKAPVSEARQALKAMQPILDREEVAALVQACLKRRKDPVLLLEFEHRI
jgi:hypothetical protein